MIDIARERDTVKNYKSIITDKEKNNKNKNILQTRRKTIRTRTSLQTRRKAIRTRTFYRQGEKQKGQEHYQVLQGHYVEK